MLVHENALVRIRRDMPLDRAALIGCGVTTGLGAVFNTARFRAGHHPGPVSDAVRRTDTKIQQGTATVASLTAGGATQLGTLTDD
jgi:hypothetical protein